MDAVDVVDVVRPLGERREGRGSNCHTEAAVSTLPYSCPWRHSECGPRRTHIHKPCLHYWRLTPYAGYKVVLFDDHLHTFGEERSRVAWRDQDGGTHGYILLRGLIW